MTDVNHLADRVAVAETVARFAWSQDLKDWAGLRAILADTVTMDVSEHLGGPSQELSADDFVVASRAVLEGFQSTHHSTSNVIVEVEGDHATYRSFVVAYHHVPTDEVDWLVVRAFWHVDLQRAGNEWRLRRIRVVRKAPFAGNSELYAIAKGARGQGGREVSASTDDVRAVPFRMAAAMSDRDVEKLVANYADDFDCVMPVHPDRSFRGADQVRANYTKIFARYSNGLDARVIDSVVDGDRVWTEWEMIGTRADGVVETIRGAVIIRVEDGRAAAVRFYLDPVDAPDASAQLNILG
ncbi:nuclear transport factor 2 family protein [Amycolatopsis sp. BJA-103]|uniref:nuclear transport factor 2 family protein n=1 Tax=Amycolatopsis sp. BJA-103 TaxID=1911175 RepID=UPI000C76FEC9|nr:nuclear transport factor 2 family protein [Amycolatopsis sp. BJA-103]AUI61045.1 hypothetical protein BKN51_24560 [Amycolatopsis sp. BJA-103]PNE21669.1 hypothetical protein B1H26_07920 [Amycolatopsis sp. BJA-103]